jgi:hypothetical protein
VRAALSNTYSFAQRGFGQGVSADDVAAVIQAVPGVVAVNVTSIGIVASSTAGDLAAESGTTSLSRLTAWLAQQVFGIPRPVSESPSHICPYVPVASTQGLPLPAEILVLDPDPASVVLGVMA